MLESIQHLVDRRCHCDQGELSGKELLERLPCLRSPAEQSLMDFVRDVAYLHVRHACIIHAPRGKVKVFADFQQGSQNHEQAPRLVRSGYVLHYLPRRQQPDDGAQHAE